MPPRSARRKQATQALRGRGTARLVPRPRSGPRPGCADDARSARLRRLGYLRLRCGSGRARAPPRVEPGSRAEPGLVLRPGEGVAGRAFLERRPCGRAIGRADPALAYTPATEALVRAKAPRAYLAVPVASGDTVHGVLICHYLLPHTFTPARGRALLDSRRSHRHRARAGTALPRVRGAAPGSRGAGRRHPTRHAGPGPPRGAAGHHRGRRGAVPRRRPASGSWRASSSSGWR